jgi:hypothetical protein
VKHLLIIVAIAFVTNGCSSSEEDLSYDLITYSGDLKVERFDSTATDDNRFNYNNKIYTVGSVYTYNYQYITKEGQLRNYQYLEEGWEFSEPKDSDRNEITLKVFEGREPLSEWIPDYNQTVIAYQPSNKESFEMTGIIENEANLWMHPPRDGLFQILELNPFPSIVYPLEVGNTWEWSLRIGNRWADDRWAVWEGIITNNMTYEVTNKNITDTQWGNLETWNIKAEALSELGKTSMEGVFNDNLGFLDLRFVNIDGSKMDLSLIDVTR